MTTDLQPIRMDDFYDFISRPDLRADPFPFYARLQSSDPLYRLDVGIWLASGYDYVSELLRDGRFSSDERNSSMYTPGSSYETSPFGRVAQAMLLFRDEPDHKRLRDLVQKAFTRRVVEDLRPRIRQLVDELLTPIIERGSADLISEFAYPLPVIVICELLGVPLSDRATFQEWARDFATRFEVQPLRTPEMEVRGDAATAKLSEYFDVLIEEKRKSPGDDLISSLATVEEDGDRLTHDETLATCLLLLLAGHETTANLIGNGVLALLRNRDQWDVLVARPEVIRSAVEELLRFDSPVQLLQRIALEDVTLGEFTIPRGEMVALLLAAANRDPSRFPDPDRLDVTRGDAPLVAFGGGIHFCLGAPLARLETQLALGALTQRAPGLRLTEEPRWRPTFVLRELESLHVSA